MYFGAFPTHHQSQETNCLSWVVGSLMNLHYPQLLLGTVIITPNICCISVPNELLYQKQLVARVVIGDELLPSTILNDLENLLWNWDTMEFQSPLFYADPTYYCNEMIFNTPQKSNIDTKNCHIWRELPFPEHHFGALHVSLWGCIFANPTIDDMGWDSSPRWIAV